MPGKDIWKIDLVQFFNLPCVFTALPTLRCSSLTNGAKEAFLILKLSVDISKKEDTNLIYLRAKPL